MKKLTVKLMLALLYIVLVCTLFCACGVKEDVNVTKDNKSNITSKEEKSVDSTYDAVEARKEQAIWDEDTNSCKTVYMQEWNGINCGSILIDALEKDEAGNSKIYAVYVDNHQVVSDEFEYMGQSYKQMYEEYCALEEQSQRLSVFSKGVGDELALGEELLTIGSTNGVWSELLYEETIKAAGKENMDKYIVDGRFLCGLWQEDCDSICARQLELSTKMSEARDSFEYMKASDLVNNFQDKGIAAEVFGLSCCIYVTKQELLSLHLEGMTELYFSLGEKHKYY